MEEQETEQEAEEDKQEKEEEKEFNKTTYPQRFGLFILNWGGRCMCG